MLNTHNHRQFSTVGCKQYDSNKNLYFMKKTNIFKKKSYLIILIVCIVSYSCCTKKYCGGIDSINTIDFVGYNTYELDTIILKKYEKNSSYQIAIDSFILRGQSYYPDSLKNYIGMQKNLSIEFDYTVLVKKYNRIYKIGNFVTKTGICNNGICKDSYKTLESYEVNNIRQNGLRIYLTK